jgi:hypothetical protein
MDLLRTNSNRLIFALLTSQLLLNLNFIGPVTSFSTSSKHCKKAVQEANRLDTKTKKQWNLYQKSLTLAIKTELPSDNIAQTSNLLKTLESDRSLFLFLLNTNKCISSSERKNIQWDLERYTERTFIVRSWIEAEIGIPPYNFYKSFINWKLNLEKPSSGYFCEKKGIKKDGFECNEFPDGLFWKYIKEKPTKTEEKPSQEIDDFIDGKVSLYGARVLAKKLYEELTLNFSESPMRAYETIKKTAYPGLFDFNSEKTLVLCKLWTEGTLEPGSYSITFFPSLEQLKPDPGFTIKDDSGGVLLLNQKFKGQVFVLPVTVEFKEKGLLVADPIVRDRRVAVLDGIMYQFSGC